MQGDRIAISKLHNNAYVIFYMQIKKGRKKLLDPFFVNEKDFINNKLAANQLQNNLRTKRTQTSSIMLQTTKPIPTKLTST
jgi:hypothetical protein